MSYNRRNFIKTSSLGAIAASSLSINCQNNLAMPSEGVYMGDVHGDIKHDLLA